MEPAKSRDPSSVPSPSSSPPKSPSREQEIVNERLANVTPPVGFQKKELPDHIKAALRQHDAAKKGKEKDLNDEFVEIDPPDAVTVGMDRKQGPKYSSLPVLERILSLIQGHKQLANTEGVFRLGGNMGLRERVMNELVIDPFKDLSELEPEKANIHELINILKKVLVERNVALLEQKENTMDKLTAVMAERDPGEKLQKLKEYVLRLNPDQKIILVKLLNILATVTANSSVNKMTASNLAIAIGPSLMPEKQKSNPQAIQTGNAFCEFLFANAKAVIPELLR